jgi:hypothetical protein
LTSPNAMLILHSLCAMNREFNCQWVSITYSCILWEADWCGPCFSVFLRSVWTTYFFRVSRTYIFSKW